eukprot:5609997-Pleurochrysis_carterae.AAC.2
MSGKERESKHANSLSDCPRHGLEPAMGADAYPCRWIAVHADVLATHGHAAALRHCPCSYGEAVRQRCVCDIEGTDILISLQP